MSAQGTGDDDVHCNLCGKTTSAAMIVHHLVTEHGVDPEEIARAPVVDMTGEQRTPEDRIEGLRNLRQGYGLTAAVGYLRSLHGEDLIEEYAALAERVGRLERALRPMLEAGWWREEVDVNGEYETTRPRDYLGVIEYIRAVLEGDESSDQATQMAHLRELPRTKCSVCGKPATRMLYNGLNAPIGAYCARDGERALRRFQETGRT